VKEAVTAAFTGAVKKAVTAALTGAVN